VGKGASRLKLELRNNAQLTENEKAWIEFIRVISNGRDPGITVKRVQALRELLDAG